MEANDKTRELEILINVMLDGSLTPDQQLQLETLLANDPDLRKHYSDYLDLHVMLEFDMATHMAVLPKELTTTKPKPKVMKLWIPAAAAALVAGFMLFVFMRPQPEVLGKLTAEQPVQIMRKGRSFETKQADVHVGDTIITKGIVAKLALAQAQVVLWQSTTFTMPPPAEANGLLKQGRISCSVHKQAPGKRFAIITDDALITVMGTTFTVEKDGETTVAVEEGQVQASNRRSGEKVTLNAGSRVSIAKEIAEPDNTFGPLRLVDRISATSSAFGESAKGVSRVETILGRDCRVLPPGATPSYIFHRIGKGKGLRAGKPYVLEVVYPEDKARHMFIVNEGCATRRGLHTGNTVGDVLRGVTNNNPESLKIPLTGRYQSWRMYFRLHERYPLTIGEKAELNGRPSDGFPVIITQASQENAPLSAGAAFAEIRLWEVLKPEQLTQKLRRPPSELPQRHIFWREELGDSVISQRWDKENRLDDLEFYKNKVRLMRFLGIDTFCKDLLEYGANQGWDSSPYGGNRWVYQPKNPKLWQQVLDLIEPLNLKILPYYEYCGGKGRQSLGVQRHCQTLGGGLDYTHLKTSQEANADITDSRVLEDWKKVLDCTVARHKDQGQFLGIWMRTRVGQLPMSFSNQTLARFAAEANGGKVVTRKELQENRELLEKYYEWWFARREQFLRQSREYLEQELKYPLKVLFTADSSEPGIALRGRKLVTDDVAFWQGLKPEKLMIASQKDVLAQNLHASALVAAPSTWGRWEFQHATPQADPQHYAGQNDIMMTYSLTKAYSAAKDGFESFRVGNGDLAVVRHFALNHSVMHKDLGHFISDMERAGPFCMLPEARAVAFGDPRYLGYLTSGIYNRGFPKYVRRFNAAFLSLPALPSQILPKASADGDIVVREIKTKRHGNYYAVVNIGFTAKTITITLPAFNKLRDASTGELLETNSSTIKLRLYPCELKALHSR